LIHFNFIGVEQKFGGRIALRHMCLNRLNADICGNDQGLVEGALSGLFDLFRLRFRDRHVTVGYGTNDNGGGFSVRPMHQR